MGSYNYYKMFGCFNRKFKMNDTGPPPDVSEAFSVFSESGTHMSADQLLRFLIDFQGEVGCTLSDAEGIMHQILHQRHHLIKYTRHYLSLDDFFYFLFHDDLNPPIKSQVHHDMTAPLQHYFIYTGHNSYLTGNQLSSDCSDIPIINALERGVRGIELDLWPNSAKDEIHVLHGRTLTTPVTLDKCFKSIRQYAFIKSPYPVIVTLEDHLTPSLRAKVAEMAIRTFGELLYHPEPGCFDEFPSPEELKHHIILSTKPPKEYLESKNPREKENTSPMEKNLPGEDFWEKETPKLTAELEADQGRLQRNNDQDEDGAHNHTPRQLGESEIQHVVAIHAPDHRKSNSDLDDEDDEDHGSDSHKSSQQGAPEYKRLFAMQSADLKLGPPDELAEGCSFDNNISSQLGEPDEHAEGQSFAYDKSSKLGAPDDLAEDHNIDNHESSQLGAPEELAEDHSLDNQNSSQLGTAEYKRLFAFQAAGPKIEEDLDVYTKRPCQLGAIECRRLGSLLEADAWRNNDQANGDDDVNKFNYTASAYKHLIAIHAEKPKDGLRRTLLVGVDKVRRLSLSEQELERAAEFYGTDVVRFTQKNLVRVYPKGTRVTSSNFKPLTGWMVGAQMVAFNMQGYGKSLWLMHGMFRANGSCGYVKKPEFLRKKGPHEVFDPKVTLPVKKNFKGESIHGGWMAFGF